MPGQRESRNKTIKFKGKRQMRQGPTSMPAQRQGVQQAQPGFNVLQEEPESSGSLVDQIEFEQRLKALKVRCTRFCAPSLRQPKCMGQRDVLSMHSLGKLV